jgi:RNA polymerase sigma factor (sigma-70 family)
MRGSRTNGRNRLATAAIRSQPDSRLVSLVREGHDLAFEEIVRRYRPPLVAFAGAIVPRDGAEDVVQEALTKAHGALGRDQAEINLRPWLYTIVRNRALNALRDQPVHDHLDENFDGVPQPPHVAARREELAALIAAVQSLPGPQREAILKRELEGRSHDEIAASLDTTPGAVRGLIYRARTALRDGIGVLIPLPVIRAVLGSGLVGSDAAGAGGAAAAGLAAGGGGVAMKAGATLGVAVVAVGSGIAIEHRSSRSDETQAAARSGALTAGPGSARAGGGHLQLEAYNGRGGPGSGSDGSGGVGDNSGPSSSSGPGSGGGSGHGSSGEGSASGSSGSGSGDSGSSSGSGSSGSGSGGSGSGDGSSTSDSGSSGSGSGDGSSTSGSGSSGSGGGSGETLDATTSGGDGSSGSGSGGSLTTTTTDGGGSGTSGGSG